MPLIWQTPSQSLILVYLSEDEGQREQGGTGPQILDRGEGGGLPPEGQKIFLDHKIFENFELF